MKRPIRIEGDIAYVPLTHGYEAIINASDVPLVDGVNWYAMISYFRTGGIRTVYAARIVNRRGVLMHRLISRAPDGMQVDHVDGDGLNDRRENMRIATPSQNSQNQKVKGNNKTGVKGVCFDRARGKFRAEIRVDRKVFSLGRFDRLEDAASAYAKASAELHVGFGRLG